MLGTNIEKHTTICKKLTEIYEKKNHDYGDSFHKTFEEWGMPMVCIRLSDKVNRLSVLSKTLRSMVVGESIEDTLMDLANYAIMALIELDRKNDINSILASEIKQTETVNTCCCSHEPNLSITTNLR